MKEINLLTHHIKLSLCLDWELQADGIVCSGKEEYKGKAISVEACGRMCKGISKWFILAKNVTDGKLCVPDKGCSCYCETSTNINNVPICNRVANDNYLLYKLKGL